ncbi:MAG: DUF5317 domain-containing protein [Actinomycetes bacterium]
MLVLALCIVGLLSPLLFNGKLSRLALVRFRGWWVVVAALLSQILIIEIFPEIDRDFLDAVHLATYVAAGVFVLMNWNVPGLLIIAAGGAMNGITIALNGGQLPASREALKMAGIELSKSEFVNSGVLKDPVLPLFGDIFVWPNPFPFANVYSFGDVLIVIGTFYGAHKITGSRLVKRAWVSPEEKAAAAGAVSDGGTDPAPHAVPSHAPTQVPVLGGQPRPTAASLNSPAPSGPRHRAAGHPAVDGA